ncbi:MAG: hypothetical protein NTX65_12690 [Ignavibacteriales bacterium]|nr:hypothetical protein [Ignavibacteriales bacterium]
MKNKCAQFGLFITIFFMTSSLITASDLFGKWRWVVGFQLGGLIPSEEISRNINATGGEQLIGRLGNCGIFGGQFGLHNELLGFDVFGGFSTNQIEVKNEFGVDFPNHGSELGIVSGNFYVYPFHRILFDGKMQPYAMLTFGITFFSVDTDNINDKERYSPLAQGFGAGVKFEIDTNAYLDLNFRKYSISSSGSIKPFDNIQVIMLGLRVEI